jgi:hypothetical protein
MLMIERRGEQYWVQFLPTNDQFSAFALPPTSFPDMHSLTHFLRNTLQVPQEVINNSPSAQSTPHILNFKLPVEISTQPQPLQDCFLHP